MQPSQVLIYLLIIDLFLFYGVGAMGETPYIGTHSYTPFVNTTDGEPSNQTSTLLNPTTIGGGGTGVLDLIPGAQTAVDLLNGARNFMLWIWSIITMPFVIGDIMELDGIGRVIPGAMYTALLSFALYKIARSGDI